MPSAAWARSPRPWRKAATAHGVEIETGADVAEVLIEQDSVVGVVLEDGRIVRGKAVAANVNLKLLYTQLMPDEALPPAFLHRMQNLKCASGSFRMNVALSELPSFTALPGKTAQPHHGAGIIIGPSLAYMDRAYRDAVAAWLEPRAGRRDADSLDARRQSRAARRACGEPVLPARGAGTAGRPLLGRRARRGRRSDDRDRRPLRAGLRRRACVGRQALEPARSGTHVRPGRRRHLPRRADAQPAVLGASDARLCRLSRARCAGSTTAAPARIPAAASPARRATTRRKRSSPTSSRFLGARFLGAISCPSAPACISHSGNRWA